MCVVCVRVVLWDTVAATCWQVVRHAGIGAVRVVEHSASCIAVGMFSKSCMAVSCGEE